MPLLGSFGVSSFGLGKLAAVEAASSYELLETAIAPSNVSSLNFSNVSQYATDYQHLELRGAVTHNSTAQDIRITFNGQSGTGIYKVHLFHTSGSTLSSNVSIGTNYGTGYLGYLTDTYTACFVADILDPFETSKNTLVRSLSGSGSGIAMLNSTLWLTTTAVSSIAVVNGSSLFTTGSRVSLYGLKAA